jgi:ubiquinone/menaquinone biosynthesis C-methylase UbiE
MPSNRFIWLKSNPRKFLRGKRAGLKNQRRQYVYQKVENNPPQIYLDIACGPGIDYEGLLQHGFESNYVGLDVTHNFLSYTKGRFPTTNLILASSEYVPIRNNCIDLVVVKDLLEHLPQGYDKTIEEIIRICSYKIIISWFIPPIDGPSKIGIDYPFKNIFHKIFVFLFKIYRGKIQYNLYNRNEIIDKISSNGSQIKCIVNIGKNIDGRNCEVWILEAK